MSILQDIASALPGLTKKQRSIAEFITSSPEEAAYMTLRELSLRAGASEVSVLRTCRALGHESFVELKSALREYTVRTVQSYSSPRFQGGCGEAMSAATDKEGGKISREELLADICGCDLANLSSMVKGLSANRIFSCARDMLASDSVFIFAHDATNIFAGYLKYRLDFLRVRSARVKLGDGDTLNTALAGLKREDFVVLMSFPPYYQQLEQIANYCRMRGSRMMAVTDSPSAPVTRMCDDAFICRTASRYFYSSQVATASFINILTSCISIEMGPKFAEILDEEKDVSDFMDSPLFHESKETGAQNG